MPLAAGLAVAESLGAFGAEPLLKWPNDLLLPRPGGPPRKLGGILIDRVPSPLLGTALVAGVGLNVDAPPKAYPPELRASVVQLSEAAGRALRVDQVERVVLPALLAVPDSLDSLARARSTLERVRARLFGRGRPVRLDGRPGGVIEDLAEDGALVLADGPVRTRVVTGEVVVEEA